MKKTVAIFFVSLLLLRNAVAQVTHYCGVPITTPSQYPVNSFCCYDSIRVHLYNPVTNGRPQCVMGDTTQVRRIWSFFYSECETPHAAHKPEHLCYASPMYHAPIYHDTAFYLSFSEPGDYGIALQKLFQGGGGVGTVHPGFFHVVGCAPQSDFVFATDTICAQNCVQFTDKSNRNATAWHWEFEGADRNYYEGKNPPPVCFADTGKYRVKLVAENRFGADTVSKQIMVTVKDCRECLYIPEAFTPNADGNNDVFRAFTSCRVEYYNLKVFNRWGAKIFETENIHDGWDGKAKQQPLPNGVYVYYITFHASGKLQAETRKGAVALIK